MVRSTSAPIMRAVVRVLRSDATLKAAIKGGYHDGFAPAKTAYPLLTYQLITAPYGHTWDRREILCLVDVSVWAESPVTAKNCDQLVLNALDDAQLEVDGQTTLICRRVADIPGGAETDSEGKKIYQIGGSYEIWTDQPL